jgi:hypothetical protein
MQLSHLARITAGLLAPLGLALGASAQSASVLTADLNAISVTSGGVQTLTLTTNTPGRVFSMIGSFSGTFPPEPNFAYGGLYLARDRYLILSYTGRSRLLPGGLPNAPGGHELYTDAQGRATQLVVVPPNAPTHLVGRTVLHGAYTLSDLDLLPSCGSNVVPLVFTP